MISILWFRYPFSYWRSPWWTIGSWEVHEKIVLEVTSHQVVTKCSLWMKAVSRFLHTWCWIWIVHRFHFIIVCSPRHKYPFFLLEYNFIGINPFPCGIFSSITWFLFLRDRLRVLFSKLLENKSKNITRFVFI